MSTSDLARLYATEHGRLRRLIRRIIGSAEAAEDIVHDTIVKLDGRDLGASDIGLLVRTAQNLARDARRSERVRAAYVAATVREQHATGPAAPDEALAARQELDQLFEALKALPPRTRRVFLLSRVDGRTYPAIARALGVSVSTVEKEMVSALEFCRTWKRRRDGF